MSSRTLAVFDFDHTITECDTAARFFVWLLRRRLWRLAVAALALPLIGPLFLVRPCRRIPVRFGVWLATFGVTHKELFGLARAHVMELVAESAPLLRSDARARIALHQAQGDVVVVATGALEFLAHEILLAGGASNVEVVGSSVRKRWGGMVVRQHCIGKQKLSMLEARGFSAPFTYVYSDHSKDLPLLEAGEQRYIINPQARCAEFLSTRLGASALVLSWE